MNDFVKAGIIFLFICVGSYHIDRDDKALANVSVAEKTIQPKTIKVKLTAYCSCKICCGKYANGRTSIGKRASILNGVAADPDKLHYGTMIYIPNVGYKVVDDCGAAMRISSSKGIIQIDIRMRTHKEARDFGVKWADIVIEPLPENSSSLGGG